MKRWLAVGSACASLLIAGAALGDEAVPAETVSAKPTQPEACQPARVWDDVDELPEAWGTELEALVEATTNPAQPWGCPAAALALEVDEDGMAATLRVDRPGKTSLSRRLGSPLDVVPVGQAMLARPLAAQEPVASASMVGSADAVSIDADAGDTEDATSDGPRALAEINSGVRYAGITDLLLMGGQVRAALPFSRFSASIAVRYAQAVAELGDVPPEFAMTELGFVGGLAFSAVQEPVRFDLGIHGGIAVVDMEGETDTRDPTTEDVDTGAVDGRVGIDLRLSIPLGSIMATTIAIDADIAPASVADSDRRMDPRLPPLPAYSIGLNSGLEVRLP